MKTLQEIQDLGFKLEVLSVDSKNVKVTFSPGESRMTIKIPQDEAPNPLTSRIVELYARRQFSIYEGTDYYKQKKTMRTGKSFAMVCDIVEKEFIGWEELP